MIIVTATARRWRRLSRTIKLISYVGMVSAAIVSSAAAWPIIEWAFPAYRGYVVAQKGPLLARVIEIELKQVDAERKRILRDVQKNEIELQSDQAKATPQYHKLIQKEIERSKNELDENDAKQKSLFNEKLSK